MERISAEDAQQTSSSPPNQAVPKYASSRHRNTPFSYDKKHGKILNRFIDEPRSLRVAVIGGGITGIVAGILLPQKVPGIQLAIYDKNHDFGGTWLENVYPGVRCDIPSHVYQSTFSPKQDWSDKFAPGAEIRDYWQSVARKYDVYQYARFGRRVDDVSWKGDHWDLTTQDPKTGQVVVEPADFVITAVGKFNSWKLPDYPGIAEYEGHLRHASNWDPTFDPSGKRVAVIGNGASGIQVVANLQNKVKRLDHYARSKTWIAASWAGDDRLLGPQPITPDQIKEFSENPESYVAFRKEMEEKYWLNFQAFFRSSSENANLRQTFVEIMKKRVAKKPELLERIIPDFSPHCRRLTPGPGYLEAISEDNVDFIDTAIKRFTKTGIETIDGVFREVDAVICATGANADLVPPFAIRADGQNLQDVWKADGEFGFAYSYLGVATPGFPNLVFIGGPYGSSVTGTVPHSVENQITYTAKVLRKIAREGIESMSPSVQATDDFIDYADAFFAGTVLTDGCSSWFNGGKPGHRIHGIWPGSGLHFSILRREPKWEDWDYKYLSGRDNRFDWYLGNGWSRREQDSNSGLTNYLTHKEVDLKDIHENWWSFSG